MVDAGVRRGGRDHLGYDKHGADGKHGGNSRNGKRSKTVLTDVGPAEITMPRDRDRSFEPKIVKKRHRCPRLGRRGRTAHGLRGPMA
ncbi:hypothetical protein SALBM311S_08509 [Streptomyces alboniger]